MKRTRIRNRSARMAALLRIYAKKRRAFLDVNPWCLACGAEATEVHHKAGRVGDLLLDESRWAAMCHTHHTYATEHPTEAIERGWSLPRVALHVVDEDGAA